MTWPDFYPNNCPPADAVPAFGTIYRLVRQDPAQAEDFKSHFEERRENLELPSIKPSIKNCGLSVQKNSQDSEKLKRSVPRFRKHQIAEGTLNPTLGMIKHTPSKEYKSHHTWWVPLGAEPWLVFNIMDDR